MFVHVTYAQGKVLQSLIVVMQDPTLLVPHYGVPIILRSFRAGAPKLPDLSGETNTHSLANESLASPARRNSA